MEKKLLLKLIKYSHLFALGVFVVMGQNSKNIFKIINY